MQRKVRIIHVLIQIDGITIWTLTSKSHRLVRMKKNRYLSSIRNKEINGLKLQKNYQAEVIIALKITSIQLTENIREGLTKC